MWTVKNGGRSVGQEYSGQYSGEAVGHIVGKFKGVARQRYILEAHVSQDAPAFQVLQPHLEIRVTPPDFKAALIQSAMLKMLSGVLCIVAVVCMAIHWIFVNRRTAEAVPA